MADIYDILIWSLIIIPIIFLGLSLLTHPTYLHTEVQLSDNTIEEKELKETLTENQWNNYIETMAEINSINNERSSQNKQNNTCTCQINENTSRNNTYSDSIKYPSPSNVVLYQELNQNQKEIYSYLKVSNNTIDRRIYDEDSFLYKYPQYNVRSYSVNGTIYSYDDLKPFLENRVIEDENGSFYIIEKNSTTRGKYTYLNDADYTFLLFVSFGLLMDYLNTVLKRKNRQKNKNSKKSDNTQNSNTQNDSDNNDTVSDPNDINIKDSEDIIDSESDSDFDDLEDI